MGLGFGAVGNPKILKHKPTHIHMSRRYASFEGVNNSIIIPGLVHSELRHGFCLPPRRAYASGFRV